jgi:hypothetical protein
MHLAFLLLEKIKTSSSPPVYAQVFPGRHQLYTLLKQKSCSRISHVQRAAVSKSGEVDAINYYFIEDAFGVRLRWWQEPVPALESLVQLKPDVILVAGLDLPLNFRWLRRLTGIDIKIIGCHTGETIWPRRNLWLQQFGLRVADAFLFQTIEDNRPWKKASVILTRQPVYQIESLDRGTEKSAEQLNKICSELIGTP